jgi:hypothetical protein
VHSPCCHPCSHLQPAPDPLPATRPRRRRLFFGYLHRVRGIPLRQLQLRSAFPDGEPLLERVVEFLNFLATVRAPGSLNPGSL